MRGSRLRGGGSPLWPPRGSCPPGFTQHQDLQRVLPGCAEVGGGAACWETQREGRRTWLGLRCRNFTPEEMKRSLLQALRSHAGTHTGQPPSPPSGSTPGVGKAGWRGRSPRREAAWANAWKWEPRGEPGPGERWGRLAQCHPERGVVPCQGWEQVLPGSARGGGFSCLAPPSRHASPRSAPCPACLFLVSPSLHHQLSLPLAHLHPCPSTPRGSGIHTVTADPPARGGGRGLTAHAQPAWPETQ